MNRTRIKYFLHLADSLNFSDTARAFRITQPALSKAIKRLEEDIGGVLIRREGRLSHLTPLGRAMLEKFQDIEYATRAAEKAAKQLMTGGTQQLNIAVMCTVSPKRIVPFISMLRRDHPNLELRLDDTPANKVMDVLLAGHCDLAILASPFGSGPRLRHTELYQEEMVLAMHPQHRFSGRETVSPADLQDERYIDRLSCEFRDMFKEKLHDEDISIDVAFSTMREDWVHEGVANDVGVTLMPEDSIDPQVLRSCPIAPERYWRMISMAVAVGREDTEAVRWVLKAARQFDWSAQ